MDKFRSLPGTPLQHTRPKGTGAARTDDSSRRNNRSYRNKTPNEFGLVGLVNIGNSCYMNATLQALSNCPPFRQYFIDCHQQGASPSSLKAADILSNLFRQIWTSERHPGHLSPRKVSSAMKNKMFKGTLQQDAQEFLRCLLSQVHEEIGLLIPPALEGVTCGCGQESCDHHRNSSVSCASNDSDTSNDSSTKLVGSAQNSPNIHKKTISRSSSSPSTTPKFPPKTKGLYSKLKGISKNSLENIHLSGQARGSKSSLSRAEGPRSSLQGSKGSLQTSQVGFGSELRWREGEVFVANLETSQVTVHGIRQSMTNTGSSQSLTIPVEITTPSSDETTPISITETTPTVDPPSELDETCVCVMEDPSPSRLPNVTTPTISSTPDVGSSVDHSPSLDNRIAWVALREKLATKRKKPNVVSIVSQVFEGVVESKVTCLSCKKVSVIQEPFHDLSLPIPGRKEMAKFNRTLDDSSEDTQFVDEESKGTLRNKLCSMLNSMATMTRDMLTDPLTNIGDCLNAFFDDCELKGDNKYYCCHCKSFQNSKKQMKIVRLPEVLCIHLKRFKFDAYFSSKISRHITFPVTGLNMSSYLRESDGHSHSYNLDAVITHYGGAGGGHYVAFARNGLHDNWYEFNDTRVHPVSVDAVQSAEGYVLFYRRVPSPATQSIHNMDITALLPGPGTTLPSPDVCYLSRHWLHLVRHCAHPGPIFQHEYACRHGAVIPERANDVHHLSMAVRRDVWNSFQSKYEGGPLVARLEACQECQDKDMFVHCAYNLEQLMAKRKREKDAVHQIQQNEKQALDRGTKLEPYLLSIDWLQRWQAFIQSNTLDTLPPGPIDNSPLLQGGGANDDLKLVDSASYRKLSTAAWSCIHGVYGGGPVIVTSLDCLSSTS